MKKCEKCERVENLENWQKLCTFCQKEKQKKELDAIFDINKCRQCGKTSFLTDVCMSCCRKNHKKAMA